MPHTHMHTHCGCKQTVGSNARSQSCRRMDSEVDHVNLSSHLSLFSLNDFCAAQTKNDIYTLKTTDVDVPALLEARHWIERGRQGVIVVAIRSVSVSCCDLFFKLLPHNVVFVEEKNRRGKRRHYQSAHTYLWTERSETASSSPSTCFAVLYMSIVSPPAAKDDAQQINSCLPDVSNLESILASWEINKLMFMYFFLRRNRYVSLLN